MFSLHTHRSQQTISLFNWILKNHHHHYHHHSHLLLLFFVKVILFLFCSFSLSLSLKQITSVVWKFSKIIKTDEMKRDQNGKREAPLQGFVNLKILYPKCCCCCCLLFVYKWYVIFIQFIRNYVVFFLVRSDQSNFILR